MKRLLALLIVGFGVHAQAQNYTRQHVGNFDYYTGSNGYTATGQQVGQFYYYSDSQGGQGYGQRVGGIDYFQYNQGNQGYQINQKPW